VAFYLYKDAAPMALTTMPRGAYIIACGFISLTGGGIRANYRA
jgi:hypothetical protein